MAPGYKWRDPERANIPVPDVPPAVETTPAPAPPKSHTAAVEAALAASRSKETPMVSKTFDTGVEPDRRPRLRAEARASYTTDSGTTVTPAKPAKLPVPRFQDPPPVSIGPAVYFDQVIPFLKQHPGKWAIVREGASKTASTSGWTKRGCEAVTRQRYEGDKIVRDVYARWPEVDRVEDAPDGTPRYLKGHEEAPDA